MVKTFQRKKYAVSKNANLHHQVAKESLRKILFFAHSPS